MILLVKLASAPWETEEELTGCQSGRSKLKAPFIQEEGRGAFFVISELALALAVLRRWRSFLKTD